MPGYATRVTTVTVGNAEYSIRALSDRQQFSDPHGLAKKAGISSAQWSLFGQLWPASRVLAEAMHSFDIGKKRILEVGCGLGLASLVLHKRKANITATDHHPLAEIFLQHNAKINQLPPITYHDLPWNSKTSTLGSFDVIIGSDILYERDHAAVLAGLLIRHAKEKSEVIFTDPGRGNSASFTRFLTSQGYAFEGSSETLDIEQATSQKLKVLKFVR
jgi:predicted nicotinamide N-methyase